MSTDEEARRIWRRIEVWLAANAPALAEALRPGASEEALARTEARMGLVLPAPVRSVYRVHEGGRFLAFVEDEVLSLEQMARTRASMNDIGWGRHPELPNEGESRGPVKPMWWNPLWVPFVGTQSMLCIDLDPAPGGSVGQIVEYIKGDRRRTVVFPSIMAWLEHWAGELEDGAYYFDEDGEELVAAVTRGPAPPARR